MHHEDPFAAALHNLHSTPGDISPKSTRAAGDHHAGTEDQNPDRNQDGHDLGFGKADAAAASRKAQERLAEEALLANPAEMRRQFPGLLKALDKNHDGHLDRDEVCNPTTAQALTATQKSFLAILQKGYGDLSRGFGQLPGNSCINTDCLAVVDKAINRDIQDDPLYANRALFNFGTSVLSGAAIGLVKTEGNGKAKLAGAAITAFEMTTTSEGGLLIKKWNGEEDKDYDQVKERYLTFRSKWSS